MSIRWIATSVLVGGVLIAGVGAAVLGVSRVRATASAPASASIGRVAPDFALQDATTGKLVRLSDYRGKTVILNFWATWCGPCRFELPVLERMYLDRGDTDFVVLAVNVRESNELVATFRQSFAMSFPVLLDRDGAAEVAFGERVLPKTFFIDRNGVVRGRHVGSIAAAELARGLQFAETN